MKRSTFDYLVTGLARAEHISKSMSKSRQERVVHTRDYGSYRLRCMRPGKWEHWTGEVSVVFTQWRPTTSQAGRWVPSVLVDGEMRDLEQYAATRLETAVKRFMFRARAAHAVGHALSRLGAQS